jgi:hypothetical protein
MGVFALRDIKKGEELWTVYGDQKIGKLKGRVLLQQTVISKANAEKKKKEKSSKSELKKGAEGQKAPMDQPPSSSSSSSSSSSENDSPTWPHNGFPGPGGDKDSSERNVVVAIAQSAAATVAATVAATEDEDKVAGIDVDLTEGNKRVLEKEEKASSPTPEEQAAFVAASAASDSAEAKAADAPTTPPRRSARKRNQSEPQSIEGAKRSKKTNDGEDLLDGEE